MINSIVKIFFVFFICISAYGSRPIISSVSGFKIFKMSNGYIYIDSNEIDQKRTKNLVAKFNEILIFDQDNKTYKAKYVDSVEENILVCETSILRKFWRYKSDDEIQSPVFGLSVTNVIVETIETDKFSKTKLRPEELSIITYGIEQISQVSHKEALSKSNHCLKREMSSIKNISCGTAEFLFINSKLIESSQKVQLIAVLKIMDKIFYLINGMSNDQPYNSIKSGDGEWILIRESTSPKNC